MPTQSDYGMLRPRQEIAWREWWYPVHDLGEGFEFATKDLAVQTSREGENLQLRMIATGRFRGASCVLSRDGKVLLTERLNLSPKDSCVVHLSPAPAEDVNVTIKTRQGDVLASFITPLPIPSVTPPPRSRVMAKPDAELTLNETHLKARKYDLATNRKQARAYYEKALAADAGYAPALRGLAVLDVEAALYEDALRRLEKAIDRDPDDGLAWYFRGVSHLRLRHEEQALRCARQAARYAGTAALAFDLAGRGHAALGQTGAALTAFERAEQLNPRDTKARDHRLLALYAAGNERVAFREAKRIVSRHATDLLPRALCALRGNTQMKSFVEQARTFLGETDFEMLETSLVFAETGLVREAEILLRALCVEAVPEAQRGSLPMYYLAYFAFLQGNTASSQDCLRQAATYRDFEFPSRPETLDILKFAVRENPTDGSAHLHIGNLYAHLGRTDEAVGHWQKAARLNPSLNVAHRNLGLYAWAAEGDLQEAELHYRQAILARPLDQTLYRDLAEILLAQGNRDEAIKVLESTPFAKLKRADIIIILTQAYSEAERYTDAINLLEQTPYFVNWEGQTVTWDLFHRAHIKRGRQRLERDDAEAALEDFEAALTYPENIGVGRSNKPQEATAQYWRGRALQVLGRLAEARSAWELGERGPEGAREQNESRERCRAALRESEL